MSKTKQYFLIFLLSFLLFLFLNDSFYIGLIGLADPFLYLFFSFIVIFLFVIYGYKSALPVLLVVVFSLFSNISGSVMGPGFFKGPLTGNGGRIFSIALEIIIFIFIPYFFSLLLYRRVGIERAVYYPVVVAFAVIFPLSLFYLHNNGINVLGAVNGYADVITRDVVALYQRIGLANLASEKMRPEIKNMARGFILLSPSIFISLSWMGLLAGFLTARKIFSKSGLPGSRQLANHKNLSMWKASDYLIIALLIGIIISVFAPGKAKFIGYNVILIAVSIYLVQGLAIMSFFLAKLKFKLPVRIFSYIFVFLFANPALIFVAFTGIFDTWFDFRKISINKNNLKEV